MRFNLIVLRAEKPERTAAFYEALGLHFQRERHGAGDEHLACDLDGCVLEIYPRHPSGEMTRATRLGFTVENLDAACQRALDANGTILSAPKLTSRGRRAIFVDPEGHSVVLMEKSGGN